MKKVFLVAGALLLFAVAFFPTTGGFFLELKQPPPEPRVVGWAFEEGLIESGQLDISSHDLHFLVDIENLGTQTNDFLLALTVTYGNEIAFYAEQQATDMFPSEMRRIIIEKQWNPKIAGEFQLQISLLSPDKKTKYFEFNRNFKVIGEKKIDIKINCPQSTVSPNGDFSSKIFIENLGDFVDTIYLRVNAVDEASRIIYGSDISFSLKPGEQKELNTAITIANGTNSGNYWINAIAYSEGEKKEASCAFMVHEKTLAGQIIDYVNGLFGINH